MTVDYTQPQQYTPPPPQPGQPVPPKKSGCLKAFLIGCSVLIVLGIGAICALVIFVFGVIKKSDVYREALDKVRADQRVVAALGEPINPGFWVSGNLDVKNQKGTADFTFPITGPKGSAKVHAVAATDGNDWEYSELVVTPDTGPAIDVLQP
jgi:Cytochrome oxidase complex assembly protein 1